MAVAVLSLGFLALAGIAGYAYLTSAQQATRKFSSRKVGQSCQACTYWSLATAIAERLVFPGMASRIGDGGAKVPPVDPPAGANPGADQRQPRGGNGSSGGGNGQGSSGNPSTGGQNATTGTGQATGDSPTSTYSPNARPDQSLQNLTGGNRRR